METSKATATWIKGVVVAAVLGVAVVPAAIAQSREFHFPVTTSGSATDSDRELAVEQASEAAKEQARAICPGTVPYGRIERTGTTCSTLGDADNRQYSCLVFVRADCVSRGR